MQENLLRILLVALLSAFLIPNGQADQTGDLLASHWQRPLTSKGTLPSHYSDLEAHFQNYS